MEIKNSLILRAMEKKDLSAYRQGKITLKIKVEDLRFLLLAKKDWMKVMRMKSMISLMIRVNKI
jgi:U3 small nucleolar ribonucleoprotein component